MGILNVTPDSFSDGGRYARTHAAMEHARAMVSEGVDIVDVGGESTRPGAEAVSAEVEMERVIPVIERLAKETDVVISIDTRKAAVAAQALRAGAHIVNDVSAMTHDPRMETAALEAGAGVVLMHMRGTPRTMQSDPRYDDVVREVRDVLGRRVEQLVQRGFERAALAVDPGIGFGKTLDHNLQLLRHLDGLAALQAPVAVGLSRKSFLGRLTGRPVEERLAGSLAGLVFCVLHGAHILRVHDVAASRDALRVAMALEDRHAGLG